MLWCSAFFIVQLWHPYMMTGKTVALTRQTFVGKAMSLLFNMQSMLVIAFLLLISWLQSPSAVILESRKIKSLTISIVAPSAAAKSLQSCPTLTNLDSILKSRDITLPAKVHLVKAMVFSSSHVWMWKLYYKESWAPKSWCFWTVVLEKTCESPLDCKDIKPVHPKGNQLRIFIGRTDAKAETPILWPPDVKSWLTGKDPDAGKDWGQ